MIAASDSPSVVRLLMQWCVNHQFNVWSHLMRAHA